MTIEKGNTVTHPEHTAKAPSLRIATFAMLPAFLRSRGTGAPSSARRAPLVLVALCAAAATLALAAAPASAKVIHPFLSSFDGAGTPVGSFTPSAIAVDNSAGPSSGDIYVSSNAQGGAPVIDKFSPAPNSHYLCQITGVGSASTSPSECDTNPSALENPPVPGGLSSVSGLAVDTSTGDLYVADAAPGVVDKFSPAGAYQSQITGLSFPTAVAINQATGDLYIANFGDGTTKKYDPSTQSLTTFATGYPAKVAVDNSAGPSAGDVYGLNEVDYVVGKFDSSGTLLSQLTGPPSGDFGAAEGIAVDPSSGDLYVADPGNGVVDQFDPSGVFLGLLAGAQTPAGSMKPVSVALSAAGDVYVIDRGGDHLPLVDVFGPGLLIPDVTTEAATAPTPTTATLHGTVEPHGIQLTDCHFDYVPQEQFEAEGYAGLTPQQEAPCVPAAASIPTTGATPVSAALTNLQRGITYHFRLVAANANNPAGEPSRGADETVQTLPPPRIDEATAIDVGPHSATLTAEIDPRGYATSCQIEWGLTTEPGNFAVAYEHTEPCQPQSLGNGTADVPVSLPLAGLTEGATYHWRVLAENVNGHAPFVEHTFVYLIVHSEGPCPANEALRTGPSAALPDCRAYEQVSPTHKNGSLLTIPVFGDVPSVAEDGSRVILTAIQCFAGAQSCNAEHGLLGSPYSFQRSSQGWQATALAPPASAAGGVSHAFYSASTGAAVFRVPTPPAGEEDWYLRSSDGSLRDIGPYTSPALGAHNFAGLVQGSFATADASHLVWTMTPSGGSAQAIWPFDATMAERPTIYEYAGPAQEPNLVAVTGPQGSNDLIGTCGAKLPSHSAPGVLSTDGATVYFEVLGEPGCFGSGVNQSSEAPVNAVYARVDGETPSARTVPISARSTTECHAACLSSPPAAAAFYGASRDGSLAYFTSTQQLTDQASEDSQSGDTAKEYACSRTTGANGCNLYLYQSPQEQPLSGHNLVAVSTGDTSGTGPRVQGVLAISADGSHAYFVAKGVLAPANSEGQAPRAGADNLYLYQRDADHPQGQTSFVATLSAGDSSQWTQPLGPTNVTPDGRFLVFTSSARLTADDSSASAAQQVFRYDAENEQLLRISVGDRGFNDNGNRSTPTHCESDGSCAEDARIAPPNGGLGQPRLDPTMSDDGAFVFFQSPLALTPGALEDIPIGNNSQGHLQYAQNVYQWHDGRVSLISDGVDASANAGTSEACVPTISTVCLLGTDSTGQNVFFFTSDRLVPRDTDTELDIYDARVDGGFAEPPAGEICETSDACHGKGTEAGPSPSPGTPGFNGKEEGPKHPQKPPCKKGFVKKRSTCVKPSKHNGKHGKHKKSHKTHKRAANANRRAGK